MLADNGVCKSSTPVEYCARRKISKQEGCPRGPKVFIYLFLSFLLKKPSIKPSDQAAKGQIYGKIHVRTSNAIIKYQSPKDRSNLNHIAKGLPLIVPPKSRLKLSDKDHGLIHGSSKCSEEVSRNSEALFLSLFP